MMLNILLSNGVLIILGVIGVFIGLPLIMSAIFDKAEKEANKGNGSCLGLVIGIIVVGGLIMSVVQCRQCSEGKYRKEWEPRHTQIYKPMQNNVNLYIFYA